MKLFILTFLAIALCGLHHGACLESIQWGNVGLWKNVSFIGTQPFVGILKGAADEVSKRFLNVMSSRYISLTFGCQFLVKSPVGNVRRLYIYLLRMLRNILRLVTR